MSAGRWISPTIFSALLTLLQTENAEALQLSMDYGLRLGDVLKLRVDDLRKPYWTFKEEKTGKRRRVRLSATHKDICFAIAGKLYVFEHRLDPYKHRTRQAVYKDIKRLARALGYPNISPHSARKIYAVERYKQSGGDLAKVQHLLNHSDPAITALYCLADTMTGSRRKKPRAFLAKNQRKS